MTNDRFAGDEGPARGCVQGLGTALTSPRSEATPAIYGYLEDAQELVDHVESTLLYFRYQYRPFSIWHPLFSCVVGVSGGVPPRLSTVQRGAKTGAEMQFAWTREFHVSPLHFCISAPKPKPGAEVQK